MSTKKSKKIRNEQIENNELIDSVENDEPTTATESKTAENTKEENELRKKLKGDRWIKIHNAGEINFKTEENVMDITISENHCHAEVSYRAPVVRNYQKAAYGLRSSLVCVTRSLELIVSTAETIQAKAENITEEMSDFCISGDGWTCKIEKVAKGLYQASLDWNMTK